VLGRLFGRRPPAEEPPPDAKPSLWARIKAFFVATWNWTILLAAIAGLLLCLRLTVEFWTLARAATDVGGLLLYWALTAACTAGALFLVWQVGHGVRYLRHRRRKG